MTCAPAKTLAPVTRLRMDASSTCTDQSKSSPRLTNARWPVCSEMVRPSSASVTVMLTPTAVATGDGLARGARVGGTRRSIPSAGALVGAAAPVLIEVGPATGGDGAIGAAD